MHVMYEGHGEELVLLHPGWLDSSVWNELSAGFWPHIMTRLRCRVYRLRVVLLMTTAGIVAMAATLAFFELPSAFDATLTNITSFGLTITAMPLVVAAFGPPSADGVTRVVHDGTVLGILETPRKRVSTYVG